MITVTSKRNTSSRLLTRQERWQQQHPERRRAHEAVRRAILRGELVRQPCEDCGATVTVDAHHDDYSRPLEVTWLCRLHHVRRHRRSMLKQGGGPILADLS